MNHNMTHRITLSEPRWLVDEIDRHKRLRPGPESRSLTVMDLLMERPDFRAAFAQSLKSQNNNAQQPEPAGE